MNIPEPTNLSPCVDKSYIPLDIINSDNSHNDLIGRRFKRNVHGLSFWTKTVKEVHITWHIEIINNMNIMVPEFFVVALEPCPWPIFPLKEIIFLNW